MFKLYIKTAWRSLVRNKLFSGLNIFGLAIGMAGAILIAIWLQNMLSYDRFHKDEDQLYVISNVDHFSGEIHAWKNTPKILGPTLAPKMPEILAMTRISKFNRFLFTNGETKINKANGSYVDPDFFRMFSFSFQNGNINKDWLNGKGIVLTQEFAKALFGAENPVGKTLKMDSSDYVTVTGVLENFKPNTVFASPFFLSWEYARKLNQVDSSWENNSCSTYVKLAKGVNIAAFNNKIKNFTREHKEGVTTQLFAEPLKNNFLYDVDKNGKYVTGRIVLVRCFTIIGALLVLIACINFMNLSTAQSEKRAREVGVKKVIGASKNRLIFQFLTESTLLAFIAFLLALLIVVLTLPAFDTLVETPLSLHFSPLTWIIAAVFVVFIGLIAGSYPAFFLS
ncbi:MAG TPA: ABC transporter permease, partial [Arachidicoccus sp.]|nr:ABC transporter permease [Arachidicoccus sp.]